MSSVCHTSCLPYVIRPGHPYVIRLGGFPFSVCHTFDLVLSYRRASQRGSRLYSSVIAVGRLGPSSGRINYPSYPRNLSTQIQLSWLLHLKRNFRQVLKARSFYQNHLLHIHKPLIRIVDGCCFETIKIKSRTNLGVPNPLEIPRIHYLVRQFRHLLAKDVINR
jgi:hypothetical protein